MDFECSWTLLNMPYLVSGPSLAVFWHLLGPFYGSSLARFGPFCVGFILGILDRFLGRSGVIWGSFWHRFDIVFGAVLGSFWNHFWGLFCAVFDHFGAVFGPFSAKNGHY